MLGKKEKNYHKGECLEKECGSIEELELVVTAHFPNIWENGSVCVNELWITGFREVMTA